MAGRQMLLHHLLGSALIIILTAGCFQAVGTDFAATDAANAQPTWTLPPTNTPVPTDPPPPTQTPEPEQSEIVFGVIPTSDPFALLTPSDAQANLALAQVPTIDPILLTVTAIYAEGLSQLEVVQTPTADPVMQPQQPLDGIAMTATHIVQQATLVVGATQTQQAIEAGAIPFVPTADPNIVVDSQPAVVVASGADCIHEVRATDRNLFRIAQNYGLTVEEIARASGVVNPNLIFVGQRLTIPGCGVTGAVPLATSTPTGGAASSAQTVGSTPPPGVTFTPVPEGQPIASAGRTHSVRQGETLFEISLRYGTTVHAIAAANGLANINVIYIGQTLTIP